MNIITTEDANVSMGAGKGNENTVPIRVTLYKHPDYKTSPAFYAAPYELEDYEKQAVREHFEKVLQDYYEKVANPESKYEGLKAMAPADIRNNPNLEKDEKGKFVIDPGALDALVAAFPPVWINMMHGWAPVIISLAHPTQMGYERVVLPPRPIDN